MSEEKGLQETQVKDEDEYPPPKAVLPAMAAIYLAMFLISLDRTILGTATPSITDEFQSFGDIAWYEAGFLLPLCMLQLTFGLVYTYYPAKWVLVALVGVFELGSVVCATAPSSNALIVGRVVTGIGGAGLSSGSLILINSLVPLQSRPKYSGGIGAVFGLASILGPLAGGYLTSVTWRWCFWINLPIGAVSLVLLVFLTPNRPSARRPAEGWLGRVAQLDPLGFALIGPATVCLLFALQWGGVRYRWGDGRIIALLVLFGVLSLAFVLAQVVRKEKATVPPRIFLQRTVLSASVASFGIGSLLPTFAFYLPIWFQAVQGKSPESSGLSLLPLLLSSVVAVIATGIAVSKVGYYTPFLICGAAIHIVGAALITTWQVETSPGQWIGYQIVTGIGLGQVLMVPNVATQTVLAKEDAPIGLSLLAFVQFLGGTIFVTVGQTLLVNNLVSGLTGKVVGFSPASIASQGALSLRKLVPNSQLHLVLEVYNDSLRSVWYVGLGLACLVLVGATGLEWRSVKKEQRSDDVERTDQ